MSAPTDEQRRAALALVVAVGDTIRELHEVPAGVLYATLMDKLTMSAFEAIIRTLKNAQLVRESSHVLTWIGPEFTNDK